MTGCEIDARSAYEFIEGVRVGGGGGSRRRTVAAAQSLTFADLALLREDDLPSPSGSVILPRPLITRHPSGSWHQDIAFTWRSPSQVPLPSGMGFSRGELPAVRMSGNTTAARPSRDFSQAARAQRVALPPMLLDVIWSLPLHPGTPGQAHDDYDHLAAALRQLNTAYWLDEARNREAGDLGQAAGEHASGAIVDEDPDGTLGSRFLYAFWRSYLRRMLDQVAGQLRSGRDDCVEEPVAAGYAKHPRHDGRGGGIAPVDRRRGQQYLAH